MIGDDREREDQRREVHRGVREHRHREAQEAVAAHLQQDRGEDHRARGRRLDMRVGQPGVHRPHRHLHGERGEEGEPQPGLHALRERVLHQRRDVGGAGLPVHRHDGEQHQHRAEQRVEEELEARIDAARPAPHADDQEHRDEAALEEQVEQHEIERRERADHQGLEHQERDHVFLHARLDHLPARDDAERHQAGGEDHERQRDAVDAHVVGGRCRRARRASRRTGIPASAGSKRHTSISDTAKVTSVVHSAVQRALRFTTSSSPLQREDEQHAEDRQERRDREDRPARHQWPPREHEPGDQRRDADQHREGVVVEIAGLQPHDVARDVEHARRHAVRPEPVDHARRRRPSTAGGRATAPGARR